MPCTYFLVFLLGLLPLSTLAAAEQYREAATLDDRASMGRFCLRGPRSRFLNHPPQSSEKYIEKASSVDAAVQETVKREKMSEDDEDGNPTSRKVAARNSKESRFEEKASDYVEMSEKKPEEANKYKLAAAAAAPSKGKRSNFYDFEDVN